MTDINKQILQSWAAQQRYQKKEKKDEDVLPKMVDMYINDPKKWIMTQRKKDFQERLAEAKIAMSERDKIRQEIAESERAAALNFWEEAESGSGLDVYG